MFYSSKYIYKRYTIEDIPLLIELYKDWNWENVEEESVKEHLESLIFKQYHLYNAGVMAIFDKHTTEYFGHCGVKYDEKKQEWYLSFRFLKSFWKKNQPLEPIKSCVEYAFSHLKMNEIVVDLDIENLGAAKMLTKVGFRQRMQINDEGKIYDRYSKFKEI